MYECLCCYVLYRGAIFLFKGHICPTVTFCFYIEKMCHRVFPFIGTIQSSAAKPGGQNYTQTCAEDDLP